MTTFIDDRDPSVIYAVPTGLWKQGGSYDEYRSTTTSTNVEGATATLTFLGEVLHFFGPVKK